MQKLSEMIQGLSEKGCTDIEAINIGVELFQVETLRRKLNHELDERKTIRIIKHTRNIGQSEGKLYEMLQVLTEREKQCYLYHYIDRMTFSEIANELGISKSTVQNHIERARDKIKLIII